MKERVGRVEQLIDALQRVAAGECVVDRAVVDELLARRRQVDPIDELTPREREVLALIAEGRSNQGICRALWLSPKTVETHIRGAFEKLGSERHPKTIGACSPCSPTSGAEAEMRSAGHGTGQRATVKSAFSFSMPSPWRPSYALVAEVIVQWAMTGHTVLILTTT